MKKKIQKTEINKSDKESICKMDLLIKKSSLLDELDVATGALLVALNVYENSLIEISKIKEKIRSLSDKCDDKKINSDTINKVKKNKK